MSKVEQRYRAVLAVQRRASNSGVVMVVGQKIALGCGCVVLVAGGATVAFLGLGAYWAKGKLKQAAMLPHRMGSIGAEVHDELRYFRGFGNDPVVGGLGSELHGDGGGKG